MSAPPVDPGSTGVPSDGTRPAGAPVKRVSSNPTSRSGPPTGARPGSAGPRPGHSTEPPAGRSRSGPRPTGTRPPSSAAGDPRTGGQRPPGPRPAGPRPPGSRRPADPASTRSGRPPASVPPEAPLGESSWKAFFRPVSSSKPGTMPAGMVLVVVVAAMLVALFMSADAISRKASGRRTNSEWRKTTAEAVAKVSRTFRFDAPTKAVDDAVAPLIGHERKTDQQSAEELLAQKRAEEGGDATDPAQTAAGPVGSTPPTTIDKTPKIRKPTPDNPLKLWVGGDSISYEPGVAMSNFSGKTKLFTVTQDARASTGLARDDYFNWPQHLYRDVVPGAPDVVMIMFGGNDAQGILQNGGKGGLLYGTPEWQAEYTKRVGDTMDLLKSKNNDRLVIWMGMPPVSATSGVKNVEMLDNIYWSEAQKRPWVKYFDSAPFFSGTDGQFAKTLASADGSEHVMRANDGVHFSLTGGMRMGWAVYAKLGSLVDVTAVPLPIDQSEAPPPTIVERTEIPKGQGQI